MCHETGQEAALLDDPWCALYGDWGINGQNNPNQLLPPTHAATHYLINECTSKLVMTGTSDLTGGGYGGGVYVSSKGGTTEMVLKNL
jgi:hypothetical protein